MAVIFYCGMDRGTMPFITPLSSDICFRVDIKTRGDEGFYQK